MKVLGAVVWETQLLRDQLVYRFEFQPRRSPAGATAAVTTTAGARIATSAITIAATTTSATPASAALQRIGKRSACLLKVGERVRRAVELRLRDELRRVLLVNAERAVADRHFVSLSNAGAPGGFTQNF